MVFEVSLRRILPGVIDRGLQDLCDWWEHRHDPDVSFHFFDDVIEDKQTTETRLKTAISIITYLAS